MAQNWVEHPHIKNDKGESLFWPEGFIAIPKSQEVAFLASRFHQETGGDINWAEVATIALHVAGTHLDATKTAQDKETRDHHWNQFVSAMDIVIERERAVERFNQRPEFNRGSGIEF